MTSAAKAEALNEAVTFEYDGETYTVAASKDWDLDVLEQYEEGKVAATVKALLGPEQWATFRSTKRTVGDLSDLFEALQKAIGVSGN